VRYALWNVIGVAPRLLSPRLEEPGHRGAEADRLGGGGQDREDNRTVLDEAHKRRVEEVMRSSRRSRRSLLPYDSSEPEFLHIYPIV
jgi:hypothetical protein